MATRCDGDNAGDLRLRLREAWGTGQPTFWPMVVDELQRRCVGWLLHKYKHAGLTYEDCEDCYTDAVEGLITRDPTIIHDPYNYIFTSSRNAAVDILSERHQLVVYDDLERRLE